MNKQTATVQKDSETISERLRYLIEKIGIKQVHLANKLGVTPQAIHQLCSGKQNFSKHTKKIAQLLNADAMWLETGQGTPFLTDTIHRTKKILEFPIYDLNQLNHVKTTYARLSSLVPQEIYVTARAYHSDSIGFYIDNAVFTPRFDVDDIILVEPVSLENLIDGHFILIYSCELQKTLFCCFQRMKGMSVGWYPANSGALHFFNITSEDLIYGTYRECLKTALS